MQRGSLWLAAGALALAPAIASGDALAADLYVGHGINGTDLGADEALPVDVAVIPLGSTTVTCLTEAGGLIGAPLEFGDIEGPFDVLAGIRQVVVSSPGDGTCNPDAAVVTGLVSSGSGGSVLILAHLDASNAPVISSFTLNDSELGETEGRISAIHAAVAPAVDVEIRGETTFLNVQNGQQTFPLTLEEGRYSIRVLDPASGDRLASKSVMVDPGQLGVGIAVGSAANDTLEILRLIVDTTEPPPDGGDGADGEM